MKDLRTPEMRSLVAKVSDGLEEAIGSAVQDLRDALKLQTAMILIKSVIGTENLTSQTEQPVQTDSPKQPPLTLISSVVFLDRKGSRMKGVSGFKKGERVSINLAQTAAGDCWRVGTVVSNRAGNARVQIGETIYVTRNPLRVFPPKESHVVPEGDDYDSDASLPYQKGDEVEIKVGGKWYLGEVVNINVDGYPCVDVYDSKLSTQVVTDPNNVRYEDSDAAEARKEEAQASSKFAEYKIGQKVEVLPPRCSTRWVRAEVVNIEENTIEVSLENENGEVERDEILGVYSLSRIRPCSEEESDGSAWSDIYEVGDKVEIRKSKGSRLWKPATVVDVNCDEETNVEVQIQGHDERIMLVDYPSLIRKLPDKLPKKAKSSWTDDWEEGDNIEVRATPLSKNWLLGSVQKVTQDSIDVTIDSDSDHVQEITDPQLVREPKASNNGIGPVRPNLAGMTFEQLVEHAKFLNVDTDDFFKKKNVRSRDKRHHALYRLLMLAYNYDKSPQVLSELADRREIKLKPPVGYEATQEHLASMAAQLLAEGVAINSRHYH